MALKDWKKYTDEGDLVLFTKDRREWIYVQRYEGFGGWKWEVLHGEIMKKRKTHLKGKFETKSKALAYAKSYMRKH